MLVDLPYRIYRWLVTWLKIRKPSYDVSDERPKVLVKIEKEVEIEQKAVDHWHGRWKQ